MKQQKTSRIGDQYSRIEYTKNKEAISSQIGNISTSIGWKKINKSGICYGGPRDILEQYFNLYMAYRPIDYDDSFNKLDKILDDIYKQDGTLGVNSTNLQQALDVLSDILKISKSIISPAKDKLKLYKALENLYFIPLSKIWTTDIGLLKTTDPKGFEGKIKKRILIEFGIPIQDEQKSLLTDINRDHGTLQMDVEKGSPFALGTPLSKDSKDTDNNKKLLDDFEVTRRGYMNWLMKVKMHDTPGYK